MLAFLLSCPMLKTSKEEYVQLLEPVLMKDQEGY